VRSQLLMLQALSGNNSCASTVCTSSDIQDDFSDCVDVSVHGLKFGGGSDGFGFSREPKNLMDRERPPVAKGCAAIATI